MKRSPSIRTKLVGIVVGALASALLAAGAGLVFHHAWSARAALTEQVSVLGLSLAENTVAAVTFEDAVAAESMLSALAGHAHVQSACIHTIDGRSFAAYPADSPRCATPPPEPGEHVESAFVTVATPVGSEEDRLGTLSIRASFSGVYEDLLGFTFLLSMIFAIAGLIAILTARLGWRHVLGPLQELIETTAKVARDGDYSARIVSTTNDEIGTLIDGVNDMLRMVEHRDAVLRRAKDAEAAGEAKTQFLANMSHEIRTPLNGVLGMLDLLLASELTTDQRSMATTASESGDTLLGLVNDILDFTKIGAARLELEAIPINIDRIVDKVVRLQRSAAQKQGVQLTAESLDVPEWVAGDEARLTQILTNLVSNAIKFTVEGRVSIRSWRTTLDGGRLGVAIAVEDTGIGIPHDRRDRLFASFSQVDASTTRQYGGTGLGLAISRGLVEAMEGTIEVDSEPDIGSCFTVTIPVREVDAPEAPTPAIAPVVQPNRSLVRILLVEDNVVNRHVAARMLELAGFHFDVAEDGAEALSRASEGHFDAILMDCHMPVMDGFEATSQLRARGFDLPIIALTANAMAGDRDRCFAAGMTDYMTKPFKSAKLVELLDRHL